MSGGCATPKLVVVAACVLVDEAGSLLITRRPEGKFLAGLWEFPGGKVETPETPEQALIRELKEELGIGVAEDELTPLTFSSYAYSEFHLLMPLFLCRRWEGEVVANEGQGLAWVRAEALGACRMPPADEPLKQILPTLLRVTRDKP